MYNYYIDSFYLCFLCANIALIPDFSKYCQITFHF